MSETDLSLESRMKLHDVRNHIHLYTGKRALRARVREQLDGVIVRSLEELEKGGGPPSLTEALEEGRELLGELVDHDHSMDLAFDRIMGIVLSSYDPGNVRVVSLARLVADEVAYFHSDLRRLPVDRLTFAAHYDPHVKADPERLRRVLDNLILNAADALFAEAGGIEVSVDLHSVLEPRAGVGGEVGPGNYGTLTVRDEGAGMDPEQLDWAFRAGATTKEHHAGLGLAFVRQVVAESGASLEVIPVEPHGTQLRIYFPLVTSTTGSSLTPAGGVSESDGAG